MNPIANPARVVASLPEFWSPRILAEIENVYLKVARLHGELAWHSHAQEDELFLVLKGALRIDMEGGSVDLAEGDMFIVPKGVRHNPVATEECHVLLLESKTTLHTGEVVTARTRSIAEQLGPNAERPG
jgi:mannose-6-phosphate isomerase-like protein (cupin superfamily)